MTKELPEKLPLPDGFPDDINPKTDLDRFVVEITKYVIEDRTKINEILDYLASQGEKEKGGGNLPLPFDYSDPSHYHCFDGKDPGHLTCCLCGKKNPQSPSTSDCECKAGEGYIGAGSLLYCGRCGKMAPGSGLTKDTSNLAANAHLISKIEALRRGFGCKKHYEDPLCHACNYTWGYNRAITDILELLNQ